MECEPHKRLDELAPHQLGVVKSVEAADDDMERLMAMGVCSGRTIELVQSGDPLILKIFGSRVGVSARLAKRVWVEACGTDYFNLNKPAADKQAAEKEEA
ncbi:MAG: FeoA family protein [Verrucomicrobiales bacterium]